MRAAVRLGLNEIERFTRGRTRRTALVVMVVIPLLYGGLYLWAFWNPYGNLDRIPVALVNLDAPAHGRGGRVDAGSMLVAKLLQGHVLSWVVTSSSQADKGVADGRYYGSLTIPAGFSTALASLSSGSARPAELTALVNPASNYIASQITTSVFGAVREAAATTFSTQFLDHLFLAVGTSGGSAVKAAGGAAQIADGAARAVAGAGKLSQELSAAQGGARQLHGALGALSAGAGRLGSGLAALDTGLATLSTRAGALPPASAELSSGAQQVAAGTAKSAAGMATASAATSRIATGSAQLYKLLELYEATDPLAVASPVYQTILQDAAKLARALSALSAGLDQARPDAAKLASGAAAVAKGASRLSALAPQLANAVNEAASGAALLAPGANAVGAGAEKARAGAGRLEGGLAALASGSSSLQSGLEGISHGSSELAGGLGAAAKRTTPFSSSSAPGLASLIADPVALSSRKLHQVPNYGAAFAPYFIPLGLWVGCLMLFFLFRPLSRRAMTLGARPVVVMLGGLLPVAALGILQAALVLLVVEAGLGLRAAHPLELWGFAFLSAVTFAAVIQMLEAVFGAAGRLLALVLLILQLVSSAGTYPIQTSPGFIRWVQPLLPMSYMVAGMRDAVSGSLANLGHDAAALLACLAIAAAVTVLSARRGQVLTYKTLQPEIEMSVS